MTPTDSTALLLELAAAGLTRSPAKLLRSAGAALAFAAFLLGMSCPALDMAPGEDGYEPAELMMERL